MLRFANLSNFRFTGIFVLFVGIVSMIGCATPGRSEYGREEPNDYAFKNEKIVNRPFNQVWDELVRDLAKGFFVINNIDKESRIINVSFNSETPEKFIDCGKTRRTYVRGKENQEYVYETAASFFFKFPFAAGPNKNLPGTGFLTRRTSLDGRMNIYVAPPKEGETQVSVNARYIFTVNTSGNYVVENLYGTPIANGNLQPATYTCSFNTNQPNTCVWTSDQQSDRVTCQSKGVLETEILNFVK